MPSLVSIDDIKVWFPIRKGVFNRVVGNVRAVDGVSLDIMPGETMGLVGESGCGKTTIGRAIIGLQPVTSGRILFDGQDIAQLGRDARQQFCRSCQMVFQDPFSSLDPRQSAGSIVAYVGAVFFFISDCTLYLVRYHDNKDLIFRKHFTVMLTYLLGEALITIGMLMIE